ncbi:MAG: Ras GTPase ras2 [Bathelium mastoideum]|nr:MAG: Ras GTPase ras2 [Bathelium mastoideum]
MVKLVVLGDELVGKTTLILRAVFNYIPDEYNTTSQTEYNKTIDIDGKKDELEVLDIGGNCNERKSMFNEWFRSGEGFILMYSITSRASFNEVERLYQRIQAALEPAVDMLPSARSGPPIILVGNKSDRSDREVSTEEGSKVAESFGCEFQETSSKTGYNIDKVFSTMYRDLRQRKTDTARAAANSAKDRSKPVHEDHRGEGHLENETSKCVIS